MNPVRKFRKRNTLTGTFEYKLFYEFALGAAMTITLHVGPIRDTGSWYKPRPDTSGLTRTRVLFLSQTAKIRVMSGSRVTFSKESQTLSQDAAHVSHLC